MALGLSFPNGERPKDLPELTNEEITEHITKVFDAAAHKMASAFNSFNLSGEEFDILLHLREVNDMLTEQNRMLELAIHNFFKDASDIREDAIKSFGKMLIDKSENGVIQTSDIPEYVKEMLRVNV